MKQKLQIVTAIVAILIGLTACQKTTKDQLIGTWHCYMRYYDPSDGSFLMELTGRELLEASDVFVQDLNLMEASTERILMLQENKYVTESIDDDGRKITATYIRVR